MALADYQKLLDDSLQSHRKPYWEPLSQLAQLTEEVGELARIYNHLYGGKVKKTTEAPDDLAGEMGDIIYVLLCMANRAGVDLDEAVQASLRKAATRDKDRFPKKA